MAILRTQPAADFLTACDQAARRCRLHGANLRKESEQEGLPYDPDFWESAARDAERAARIYEMALKFATRKAVAVLRERGLQPYAEALESGDYEEHLAL